jgi:hypothetical protein
VASTRCPLSHQESEGSLNASRLVSVVAVGMVLATSACSNDSEASRSVPTPGTVVEESVRESVAVTQFTRGYAIGWRSGCDHAFERLLAAATSDAQIDFHVEDCYELAPAKRVPVGSAPDPRSAGERLGKTDGCHAAGALMQKLSTDWSGHPSLLETTCR